MTRIILVYGLISGLVIIFAILGTLVMFQGDPPHSNAFIGYLIMLVALSSIFVGVRQHRDRNLGGVIRFRTALGIGLGIAALAALAYILIWEVYLAATNYAFMDQYIAQTLEAKRAAGVSGEAWARAVAETEAMRVQYANPLIRVPITFAEIFPVGLIISLVSAALLRNPRFLPARPPVSPA